LVLVENQRSKITLTKPIAVGCAILKIAKLIMYEFYYDCLLPKCAKRLHLCFMETDTCRVQTRSASCALDFRLAGHFALSARSSAVFRGELRTLGKFKWETVDVPPTEFCGLRSKMYALATLSAVGRVSRKPAV